MIWKESWKLKNEKRRKGKKKKISETKTELEETKKHIDTGGGPGKATKAGREESEINKAEIKKR